MINTVYGIRTAVFAWLIIVSFFIKGCSTTSILSDVKDASEEISITLMNLMKDLTSYDKLKQEIDKLHANDSLKVKKVNVSKLNEEFNNNLNNLLLSRINSAKAIKVETEKLYNKYTYNPEIKPFDYYNEKLVPTTAVKEEPTFFIGTKVNISRSHVQLPSNIFEYGKEILNGAKWSEGLNEVFLKNFQQQPSLLWQYVGTSIGLLRTFPGSNQDRNVLDLYDCRRRLWYSQAINSPKDVLILLDQSGSMTGSNFNIAKLTVKSLIDTLQQNDFFNVITFAAETNFIIPCLTNLTQATTRHKDVLKSAVDNLPSPKGLSEVKTALREAFSILEKDYGNHLTSSGCTKVLLLISDGIEEDDSIYEMIEEINKVDDVAIFSFQIGHNNNKKEMKRLACRHGGELYEFPTIGNVWNRVLQYQQVLSYPIAKSKQVVFTPLYLDSSGLGMMTTIAVAAFSNVTNNTRSTLIGVAGIDIGITLVQQQSPAAKLGVFGHAFTINNNGLFLMHPRFRDQTGYLPDPATVYLNEIEHTTDPAKSMEIMRAMIDGETGCIDAELDWLYLKDIKRSIRYNASYCFMPLGGTPFSTGVSIPLINQNIITVAMESKDKYLEDNRYLTSDMEEIQNMQIADWLFCNITAEAQKSRPASLKFYPTAKELKSFLNESLDMIDRKCDNDLLWTLMLSAKIVTNFTHNYWNETNFDEYGIKNMYIVTASGFMQSFTSKNSIPLNLNRNILEELKYVHPVSFHTRGLTNTLVFTVDIKTGTPSGKHRNENIEINLGLPISADNVIFGVIGVNLPWQYLNTVLINASKEFSCKDSGCVTYSCEDVDNINCYLLDEHGFVVASNKGNKEIGYFFGYINGFLMTELNNLTIYERKEYTDTQAQCQEQTVVESDGMRLQSFFSNLIYSVGFMLNNFISFLTLLLSTQTDYSETTESKLDNVSCTKKFVIFSLSNYKVNHNSKAHCTKHCTQAYAIKAILGTNLVLVVTHDECNGTCSKYVHDFDPVEVQKVGICDAALPYRKALPLCYKVSGDETYCSSGIAISERNLSLVFFLCFLIFLLQDLCLA